ncbi:MAG: GNAT family N-acetyltransferase, partial [Pseudomonadota bacterium]
ERADDFLSLYRECRSFYRMAPPDAALEARIAAFMASGRHLTCLIADAEGTPAGFATYALLFPAGDGPALFVKEIFVAEAGRGAGVGRALLAALAEAAAAEGCSRIDWTTDRANAGARRFYAALGVDEREDKVFYRVERDEIGAFKARLGG